MSQKIAPKRGMAVSIEGASEGIAAKILTTSSGQLGLKLVKPAPEPFQVGNAVSISHYQILEKIGQGGTGEVYREDEEASAPVGRFQIYPTAEDTLLL